MPPAILNSRVASPLARKALDVAISQMGVSEVPLGSNDGPEVKLYLASIGLGPGYAWCAAFVYWCTQKACTINGATNPLKKTGGVQAMFKAATGKGLQKIDSGVKFLTAEDVRPGDIFIMIFKGGLGHTGFIEKVSGTDIFTVEGNTDPAGGREGVGVYRKRRKISAIKGLIRLV